MGCASLLNHIAFNFLPSGPEESFSPTVWSGDWDCYKRNGKRKNHYSKKNFAASNMLKILLKNTKNQTQISQVKLFSSLM